MVIICNKRRPPKASKLCYPLGMQKLEYKCIMYLVFSTRAEVFVVGAVQSEASGDAEVRHRTNLRPRSHKRVATTQSGAEKHKSFGHARRLKDVRG